MYCITKCLVFMARDINEKKNVLSKCKLTQDLSKCRLTQAFGLDSKSGCPSRILRLENNMLLKLVHVLHYCWLSFYQQPQRHLMIGFWFSFTLQGDYSCLLTNFAKVDFKGHDDVIKWKHFPHCWPFMRGIQWSTVNSPHKGQWCGALIFSLICAWMNVWVNNRDVGDLRRHRAHYDVNVMPDPYRLHFTTDMTNEIILRPI